MEESLYGRKRLFDILELETIKGIFEEIGVLYNAEDFEDVKKLEEEGKSIINLEEKEEEKMPKKKVKKKKKAKKKEAVCGEIEQENGEEGRAREVGEAGKMVEKPIEESRRENEILSEDDKESEESGKSKSAKRSKELKMKRKEKRNMKTMKRITEKMAKNKNVNDENLNLNHVEKIAEQITYTNISILGTIIWRGGGGGQI